MGGGYGDFDDDDFMYGGYGGGGGRFGYGRMRGFGGFGGFGGYEPPRRNSPLPTIEDKKIVIDQKYIDEKEWERKYNRWLMNDGEKPGRHPDDNHQWNTDPDSYIYRDVDKDEKGSRDSRSSGKSDKY